MEVESDEFKQQLGKSFQALVTTHALIFTRTQQAPTFKQIQSSVAKMSNRNFNLLDLSLIKEIAQEDIVLQIKAESQQQSDNDAKLKQIEFKNNETSSSNCEYPENISKLVNHKMSVIINFISYSDSSNFSDLPGEINLSKKRSKSSATITNPKKRPKRSLQNTSKNQSMSILDTVKTLMQKFNSKLNSWVEANKLAEFSEDFRFSLAKKHLPGCFYGSVDNNPEPFAFLDEENPRDLLDAIKNQPFYNNQFDGPFKISVPSKAPEFGNIDDVYVSSNSTETLKKLQIKDRHLNTNSTTNATHDDNSSNKALEAIQKCFSITKFYSHQIEAFKVIKSKQNLLVTTSTASGKSAIFQFAIAKSLLSSIYEQHQRQFCKDNPPIDSEIYSQAYNSRSQIISHTDCNSDLALDSQQDYSAVSSIDNQSSNGSPSNVNSSTILMIFPYKALTQNQLITIRKLLYSIPVLFEANIVADVFDGDTSKQERRVIPQRVDVLLTNPDTLHCSILPNHTKWKRFLANLSLVIIDEMHVYKGTFGQHFTMILSRLGRLVDFNNASATNLNLSLPKKLQYVLCSATVDNPHSFANKLLRNETFRLVNKSSAPKPELDVILWDPSRNASRNQQLESIFPGDWEDQSSSKIGSSKLAQSKNFENKVYAGGADQTGDVVDLSIFLMKMDYKTLVFCRSRAECELVYHKIAKKLGKMNGGAKLLRKVVPYRAGYDPKERRNFEALMFSNVVNLIVSTSALELGIDIGSLDAVVMVGLPLIRENFLQRVGRIGRSATSQAKKNYCFVVLGADQAGANANKVIQAATMIRSFLFGSSAISDSSNDRNAILGNSGPKKSENLASSTNNSIRDDTVLISHLQCAASEIPIQCIPEKIANLENPDRFQNRDDPSTIQSKNCNNVSTKNVFGLNECLYFGPCFASLLAGNLSWDQIRQYWVTELSFKPWPSLKVPIRDIMDSDWNIVVFDYGAKRYRILEEMDVERVSLTVHKGAVLMFMGQTFIVEMVQHKEKVILVKNEAVSYYTVPEFITRLRFTNTDAANQDRLGNSMVYGSALVSRKISSYKKKPIEKKFTSPRDVQTINELNEGAYEYPVSAGRIDLLVSQIQRLGKTPMCYGTNNSSTYINNVIGDQASFKNRTSDYRHHDNKTNIKTTCENMSGGVHLLGHILFVAANGVFDEGTQSVLCGDSTQLDCSVYISPEYSLFMKKVFQVVMYERRAKSPILAAKIGGFFNNIKGILSKAQEMISTCESDSYGRWIRNVNLKSCELANMKFCIGCAKQLLLWISTANETTEEA